MDTTEHYNEEITITPENRVESDGSISLYNP